MSKNFNIIIKFENSDKTYNCCLQNNNINLFEQLNVFLTITEENFQLSQKK